MATHAPREREMCHHLCMESESEGVAGVRGLQPGVCGMEQSTSGSVASRKASKAVLRTIERYYGIEDAGVDAGGMWCVRVGKDDIHVQEAKVKCRRGIRI